MSSVDQLRLISKTDMFMLNFKTSKLAHFLGIASKQGCSTDLKEKTGSSKLQSVFTWRHGSHVGVPNAPVNWNPHLPTPGKYGALMGVTKVFAPFCVRGGGEFVVFCCISFARGVGD